MTETTETNSRPHPPMSHSDRLTHPDRLTYPDRMIARLTRLA